MTEASSFASLSPTLLARKGAAKPAMRPQLQPMQQFHEATARDMGDDLGWNDMGEDLDHEGKGAEVVSISGAEPAGQGVPQVRHQQEELARNVERQPVQRKSALSQGRRAAFTLRLDGERHLKLKLASTITNDSAQQIVTEALDRYLESMPDVAALASKVQEKR